VCKVSILIPVYNREGLIAETMESALAQTYGDIEIIVVDNASTDGTWNVVQSYAVKDSRVKVFRNSENIGPVRNWRRCIEEATGEYGKILFSDDLMKEDMLAECVPLLKDEKVAFVFSGVINGHEPWSGDELFHWRRSTGVYATKDYILDALDGVAPVSPGAALFRLSDLNRDIKIKIDSPGCSDFMDHGAGPDLLLYLLAATRFAKVGFVAQNLNFFRAHPGSISVADRDGILGLRYFQAKVWYCRQVNKVHLLERLMVKMWLREIIDAKRFRHFSSIWTEFVVEPNRMGIFKLLCTVGVVMFSYLRRIALRRYL